MEFFNGSEAVREHVREVVVVVSFLVEKVRIVTADLNRALVGQFDIVGFPKCDSTVPVDEAERGRVVVI